MADTVDRRTRSRMMAAIRGTNTKPELVVRSYLHRAGIRFRLHDRSMPGRPDIVLRRHKAVVFVNGCFWHRHRGCPKAKTPKSNRRFWGNKFSENVARDRRSVRKLRALGWRVFVIWECKIRPVDLGRVVQKLMAA
jgi:DNA mismatch endonuclease (patch repair protein)